MKALAESSMPDELQSITWALLTTAGVAMSSPCGRPGESSVTFATPPDSCKPKTCRHRANSRIGRDCITLDQEEMKRSGLLGLVLLL